MRKNNICFKQSLSDFPLDVELGRNIPDWRLSRWKGDNGLRFIPLDDGFFSIRGNKKTLLYKGRRRSHRFTILGDGAFEYDCILEKEPESNVVTLFIDGAENFDFFRQPDFVPDDFLKGSYAVYKKETLIGQGTGKLCHIHRPLIIDARGRKVWGDLSVAGNELRITIPEQWLSEAKYPVVVDPTVGTTQIGSQNRWREAPGEPLSILSFDQSMPVNRFFVSEAVNGICTAYYYTNENDREGGGKPILYSDNLNNPSLRRSTSENFISLLAPGWHSGTFIGEASAGVNIWFGLWAQYILWPRFDFGAICYFAWWENFNVFPNPYPMHMTDGIFDFKLSMYFTYSSAQNYIRTLTQGVNINDSRKLTGNYNRVMTQVAGINSLLGIYKQFFHKINEIVKGQDSSNSSGLFLRVFQETVKNYDEKQSLTFLLRSIFEKIDIGSVAKSGRAYFALVTDTVHAVSFIFRGLLLFVRIMTGVFVRDYIIGRFLKARKEIILKSKVTKELSFESKC